MGGKGQTILSITIARTIMDVKIYVYCFDCCYGPRGEGFNRRSREIKIAGYSLLGAVIVGTGISGGLMGYYLNHNKDEHKTDLNYTYSFLTVSGAMSITGAVLLIVYAVKYQPALDELNDPNDPCNVSFAHVVLPSFSGITLSGRF